MTRPILSGCDGVDLKDRMFSHGMFHTTDLLDHVIEFEGNVFCDCSQAEPTSVIR